MKVSLSNTKFLYKKLLKITRQSSHTFCQGGFHPPRPFGGEREREHEVSDISFDFRRVYVHHSLMVGVPRSVRLSVKAHAGLRVYMFRILTEKCYHLAG